jgi:hypothetical protein
MSQVGTLTYKVQVQGLETAKSQAESAAKSADQATKSLENAKKSSMSFYPTLFQIFGVVNNARQAVDQLLDGLKTMNPLLFLSAFINMMQVVNNLTHLMTILKTATAGASAAQTILAVLTGNWWIIPLALTAGALIYSRIQSMQAGGVVPKTGLYLLHKKEEVVPAHGVYSTTHYSSYASTVQSFGPIFVSFERQPSGLDVDTFLRELGPRLARDIRRGG